jgi:hypothetical protein
MMACIVVGAAVSLPALLGLHSGNLVALFLLLPLMMGITGLLGGFNVSILPLLYPAGVRASGFNIGACSYMHQVAFSNSRGLELVLAGCSAEAVPGGKSVGGLLSVCCCL